MTCVDSKMLCLHGVAAGSSTTEKGTSWFCAESSSCHFTCSEEDASLYDKAVKAFLATKQDRPKCCGVTPEASAERNYARIGVVKDVRKANFGRPFFNCSKKNDECDYFAWGDERIIEKPLCKHGKPCRLLKVKKEGSNRGRNFLCCPEGREKTCKFFKWFDDPVAEDPLQPGCICLFSNPPSYKYVVKKTGAMFTSNHSDRKKAYVEFLSRGEIPPEGVPFSVEGGLFYTAAEKRKTDVSTTSGKRKTLKSNIQSPGDC